MSNVTVSISLRITCESTFRKAAHDRALADGLPEETAEEYLQQGENEIHSLGNCAVMLLDPGISPEGSQILYSQPD